MSSTRATATSPTSGCSAASQAIAAPKLREAIVEVAEHRNHDVVPLAEALIDMPERQTSYTAMLNRMSYQRVPPASWNQLLDDVRAFVDPLVADTTGTLTAWDPDDAALEFIGR